MKKRSDMYRTRDGALIKFYGSCACVCIANRPFFWPLFVDLPIATGISFMQLLNRSAALHPQTLCLRVIRHQYIRQQDGTEVEAPLVSIRIPPEPVKAQLMRFESLICRYPNDTLQSKTLRGGRCQDEAQPRQL